jgi:hypothetical protein
VADAETSGSKLAASNARNSWPPCSERAASVSPISRGVPIPRITRVRCASSPITMRFASSTGHERPAWETSTLVSSIRISTLTLRRMSTRSGYVAPRSVSVRECHLTSERRAWIAQRDLRMEKACEGPRGTTTELTGSSTRIARSTRRQAEVPEHRARAAAEAQRWPSSTP